MVELKYFSAQPGHNSTSGAIGRINHPKVALGRTDVVLSVVFHNESATTSAL